MSGELAAWELGLETALLDGNGRFLKVNPTMARLAKGCSSLRDMLRREDWVELKACRRPVRLLQGARSGELLLTPAPGGWLAQLYLSPEPNPESGRDFYHRARNHLAVISSLLHLQSGQFQDQVVRQAFADCQTRVQSLAILYGQVQGPGVELDFAAHLERLLELLTPEASTTRRSLSSVSLPLDQAVPLSLLAHELILNSLRHAPGAGLEVRLQGGGQQPVDMIVQDEGPGLPPEVETDRATSLGLRLVRTLARQLRARVVWGNGPGTSCSITFTAALAA